MCESARAKVKMGRSRWVYVTPEEAEELNSAGSHLQTIVIGNNSSGAATGKRNRSSAGAAGSTYVGGKKKRRVSVSYSSEDSLKKRLNSKKEPAPHLEHHATLTFSISQELLKKIAESSLGQSIVELIICNNADDEGLVEFKSVKFPNLRSLMLERQGLKTLTLKKRNAPKLEKLIVKGAGGFIKKFDLDLPKLKEVEFECTGNDGTWEEFEKSIARCPNLETFHSHKLWFVGGVFIMPNCRSLTLSRPDGMSELALWAPRIQEINLLACHDLFTAQILDEIPDAIKKELPSKKGYEFNGEPSKYVLNMMCTGNIQEGNIKTHNRCLNVYGEMPPLD